MGLVVAVFMAYSFGNVIDQPIKIGATYMTMNNDFYQVLNHEIEKIVAQNNDQLLTRDPSLDVDKQVEQVEDFIRDGISIIIINPVDANSQKLTKALEKAKDAGIKIVVVDSQMRDSSSIDATIVSDNYQAGVLIAQHLMKEKKEAGILLLEHETAISAVHRIRGFLDTIDGHKDYQVLDRRESLGQTEVAMPEVKESIATGLSFDTVIALNDKAAIGALAAIKDVNYSPSVSIYGVDGSPDMKSLLGKQEELKATVAQSPVKIGRLAIEVGYDLYHQRKTESEIIVPVSLVTAENLSAYDMAGWQ